MSATDRALRLPALRPNVTSESLNKPRPVQSELAHSHAGGTPYREPVVFVPTISYLGGPRRCLPGGLRVGMSKRLHAHEPSRQSLLPVGPGDGFETIQQRGERLEPPH